MKIAVRLDDITPDMDWERFYAFKALLDKYQVKPLIGVVPDNRDDNLKGNQENAPADFWNYIKELQAEGWCVAMHGFCHIYSTSKGGIFPLNNFSEFAGISYEKQFEMLSMGRKMLSERGIETDIFMAPAHSYDNTTLKALKQAGLDPTQFSAHKLRHTAATMMLSGGVDVKTVQEVLGHENLNTTQIYTHIESTELKIAAEANPLSKLDVSGE